MCLIIMGSGALHTFHQIFIRVKSSICITLYNIYLVQCRVLVHHGSDTCYIHLLHKNISFTLIIGVKYSLFVLDGGGRHFEPCLCFAQPVSIFGIEPLGICYD